MKARTEMSLMDITVDTNDGQKHFVGDDVGVTPCGRWFMVIQDNQPTAYIPTHNIKCVRTEERTGGSH